MHADRPLSPRCDSPSRHRAAILRSGENAMIIVVEVADRRGRRASKEYDQPTLSAAMNVAHRELRDFPDVRIVDVRIKRPIQQAEFDTLEDSQLEAAMIAQLRQTNEQWEEKAARARSIAEHVTDPVAITVLTEIAAYYELLARYARADEALPPWGELTGLAPD